MGDKSLGQGKKSGSDRTPPPPKLNPNDKELFLKQYGSQKNWTDEEIEMALLLGYR